MSTLKVNTLTDTAATKSVPIEDVVNGVARAWVNFNGTSTVAIRASYNVTSITDNGTGDYTVNFTNAMSDANYAVAYALSLSAGEGFATTTNAGLTTTTARVRTFNNSVTSVDATILCASIHR